MLECGTFEFLLGGSRTVVVYAFIGDGYIAWLYTDLDVVEIVLVVKVDISYYSYMS